MPPKFSIENRSDIHWRGLKEDFDGPCALGAEAREFEFLLPDHKLLAQGKNLEQQMLMVAYRVGKQTEERP